VTSERDSSPASPSRDLDAASSSPLHPAAHDAFRAALERGYADPRRLHRTARDARLILDNAREATAQALGVRADEVTFTPTGTHAVHLGLLGLVRGSRRGDTVAFPSIEHSSVHHAVQWGGRSREVGVDLLGHVDHEALSQAARDPDVGVVACQSANHEVGTVQRLDQLDLPDDVPLFVDACASMGHLELPSRWAVVAGSAHKWGGPAGVGVLLVRKGARWRNPFPADDRIDERTTGFENVPAILAAAAALQAVVAERETTGTLQRELIDVVRARVATEVPDVEVVGDPDERLPHLVTFSCLYADGEALVSELDRHGFGIASGSACAASTLRPSHVLEAMGVLTHGNVRLALQRDATREDVDRFCDVLPEVVRGIRARVGM
jgi:cysteine desulfurase